MASRRKPNAWPGRLGEEDAAEYLGVSKSTFRQRVATGVYPQPVRDGARNFWGKLQLDAFIANQFGHPLLFASEDNTWADLR
jgi:predicted DNA-binding transcriptional regulator AlpA